MEVIQELHDAVSKACEASFDKAYCQLRSQLETQAKEAEIRDTAAIEAQRKADLVINDLRHDITLLQNELKQHEVDSQDPELPRQYANFKADFDPINLWGDTMEDGHLQTQKARKRFEEKYVALYTNLQTFIESWSGLKRQVLRHKEKLLQWDQQLKRDEFTLLLNGRKVKYRKVQGPGPEGSGKMDSPTTRGSLGKRPRDEDPDLPAKSFKPSPRQARHNETEATKNAMEDDHPPNNSLASELASTQSSSPGPQMETLGSPDTIRSISNNKIQERRHAPSPTLPRKSHSQSQQLNAVTKHPVHIKKEVMSSSPIRTASNFSDHPFVGTQDLDDIGETVQTPTKRKPHRDVHVANSKSLGENTDQTHYFARDRSGQQTYDQASVLQAVDNNTRLSTGSHRTPSTKRSEDLERRAIPSVAEDGDTVAPVRKPLIANPGTNRGPSEVKPPGKMAQRRLEDLLERSTPSRSPLKPSKHGPSASSIQADVMSGHDHGRSMAAREATPEVDPDDEPYRAMPLSVLGLGHFKINPARNEGLDFAYGSVVRKKDDRKCISGCTRPGCCGDRFRAMARLGGLPGNSGAEQEKADAELLREFVGENTQLLDTLSDQERGDLLIEARARALANQYGRHRHIHQRAQSPPGFWRTDMPSTQEEELDRTAAKELEREKVEERYREAMRPGGLWIFADE